MYMSIKTCIYELIRIELSCGDMREIIFSQDFLQYMTCKVATAIDDNAADEKSDKSI